MERFQNRFPIRFDDDYRAMWKLIDSMDQDDLEHWLSVFKHLAVFHLREEK